MPTPAKNLKVVDAWFLHSFSVHDFMNETSPQSRCKSFSLVLDFLHDMWNLAPTHTCSAVTSRHVHVAVGSYNPATGQSHSQQPL